MNTTNEYNITLKIRNNLLLQSFRDIGESPGKTLADKIGITYGTLNDYISLKISPIDKHGEYRESAYKICDFLNKLPNDLWTEEQLIALEQSTAEFTATHEQMISYLPNSEDALAMLEQQDMQREISSTLNTIQPLHNQVLDLRFGLTGKEHGYQEIADILGSTYERVRSIEAKALRALRHPSRSEILRKYVDPNSSLKEMA